MHLTSIFRPHKWAKLIVDQGLADWLKDEAFLKLRYYGEMGKRLDLENPTTFNEKLQWLKLYNRNPVYTRLVDKYLVRQHIADTIGPEYLIPMLGVWDDPDEIDFDKLPDQFVLKCNHNSGLGMCICKDNSSLDFDKVRRDLRRGLQQDYYKIGREWPYKDVPRKIICEQYIVDDLSSRDELSDYKVLCFGGEPRLVEIHRGRFSGHHTQDFYDADWIKTDFQQPEDPLSDEVMDKPVFAEEMFRLSRILASDIPHVRVDWYYTGGKLYFGELTFFDSSGFSPFVDNQDAILGSWIALPGRE